MSTPRFCIFWHCLIKMPAYHDENNMPVTHATEREARLEVIDDWEIRMLAPRALARLMSSLSFRTKRVLS